MLRLKRIFKNYEETGSFNEQVNLFGFVDDHVFLTKTGDLGVILEVQGVDYECLDGTSIDGLTKRLESALKLFDENYRVYQYLFKRNNETIPYKLYGNPVVDTAIKNRIAYLTTKADTLFSLSIYYVVLYEGFRYSHTLANTLLEFPKDPMKALGDLRASLSAKKQVVLLDREIGKAQATLLQKIEGFILQVSDFLPVRLLDKNEAFRVLKKTLNFAPAKLEFAKAQIRHVPRLLPVRIASRMSPRPSAPGRLLRQSSDTQGAVRSEFPAHLQAPARSGSQLLRRHRMEKGGFRQDATDYPGQAPPFPQHEALILQPGQFERCSAARCSDRRLERIPGAGTRRGHQGDRASRKLLRPVFTDGRDLRPRLGRRWTGLAPSSTRSSASTTHSFTKRNTIY